MKSAIFEFFNRYVSVEIGKQGGIKDIYLYGVDNLLPNNNLKSIGNSGVATKAINKLSTFIEADGFLQNGEEKVNKDQTADELLSEISSYAAYNDGFALMIRRKGDGTIAEVTSICFECVRKRKDGRLTYNALLGQPDYKEKDTTVHPAYFGKQATVDQLQQITLEKIGKEKNETYKNPEILYVFQKTAANPHYPVPDYNSGIEDIQTSAEFQALDRETIVNGFMSSGMLVTHEMNDVVENGQKDSEASAFEKMLKSFTGQIKNKYGQSGRNKLMWTQVKSMEQAPKFVPFDTKEKIEATINKRDQIERSCARWIGIHPVLIGYSDAAILGNTQAIANAAKDAILTVNPIQRMITRAFEKLYPGKDWTVSQFNAWQYIPDKVWEFLPQEEKTKLAASLIGIQIKKQSVQQIEPSENGVN